MANFKELYCMLIFLMVGASIHSMSDKQIKGKNWISEEIEYSNHALERMAERGVTAEEIMKVLEKGVRGALDLDGKGTRRFIERKNKLNPLIVVARIDVNPNVVITVYRDDLTSKIAAKKEFADKRNMAFLKDAKDKKNNYLMRQVNAKSKYLER